MPRSNLAEELSEEELLASDLSCRGLKTKPVVMVIDDDQTFCEIVKQDLHGPYDLVIAHDGEAALQLLRQSTPDAIVTDLVMPKVDGIELIETIRDYSNIPIIAVTGFPLEKGSHAEEILHSQAQFLMHKPFSMFELALELRRLIGKP